MTDIPPVDVDVNQLDPGEFARLLVTRSLTDDSAAWLEIAWDLARYKRATDAVCVVLKFVEQLLTELGAWRGQTATEAWRSLMLGEQAEPGGDR